eukprot:CAMPEP_0115373390 /NCGR_PEP_ID=MMETSP0271-20121206/1408_1 /TAXON_ID=71861 /ORGANISM="Scrippsiella trochoidea, Strain CCMP3099" /LENGTH=83 /DNA_ID=CAMNT_0002796393 /DNA_START=169 /DNA_END=420 /DNA_ORIENTATION=+
MCTCTTTAPQATLTASCRINLDMRPCSDDGFVYYCFLQISLEGILAQCDVEARQLNIDVGFQAAITDLGPDRSANIRVQTALF